MKKQIGILALFLLSVVSISTLQAHAVLDDRYGGSFVAPKGYKINETLPHNLGHKCSNARLFLKDDSRLQDAVVVSTGQKVPQDVHRNDFRLNYATCDVEYKNIIKEVVSERQKTGNGSKVYRDVLKKKTEYLPVKLPLRIL